VQESQQKNSPRKILLKALKGKDPSLLLKDLFKKKRSASQYVERKICED